jgi:phenylalanyl-tRNA synthetase beta chain
MKFSESWLREWVNPKESREQLCDKLTMAGLEVESVLPVAEKFSRVVIGRVLTVKKHPEADRLTVCEVDVGASKPLTSVCGAPNARADINVPVALDGAELPNGVKIKQTSVRGVTSSGMLCSAQELGLTDKSEDLYELPQDAPLGTAIWDYLNLSDYLIDLSITPNRGDCLSIRGVAKEVSALTETPLTELAFPEVKATIQDVLPITLEAKEDCPCYVGRIIRNIKTDAATPIWMREHLRRAGIRSISAVVDVTNYVMLELGQPMHAFSLETISGGIVVRNAKASEKVKLLDDSEIELSAETLIIADEKKPLALAGVMGGLDSCVTADTTNIFLESAFFKAMTVSRASRLYGLSSDSAYRFERGIDPLLQRNAMERATALILQIAGGEPGPITAVSHIELLPSPAVIDLRAARITKILGCVLPPGTEESIFRHLEFAYKKIPDGWRVTVPARRSDISIEEDLIEEIARIYSYDNIPRKLSTSGLQISQSSENVIPVSVIRHALRDLGYQEVITYTFVEKKLQALFDPNLTPKELVNPMTPEMAVMRTSLWPGLVNVLLYNQNRQQQRIRIFETGLRFIQSEKGLEQERVISGLINGAASAEQWGISTRTADFFDMKGDLENLFRLTHSLSEFGFEPAEHTALHAALHPGQSAQILRHGEPVGVVGALHPAIIQALKIDRRTIVFELNLDRLEQVAPLKSEEISRFPEIRRDIAILIEQSVPAKAVQDTISKVAGDLLKQVDIFDVYQGKGIEPGRKSVALALTLQHASRTLVDDEVAKLMDTIIIELKGQFNAELRG